MVHKLPPIHKSAWPVFWYYWWKN